MNSNLAHSLINLSKSDFRSSINPSSLSPRIYFSGMQGIKQPGHLAVKVACRMWNSLYLRTTSNLPCESCPVTVYLIILPNFCGLVTLKRCAEFSSSSKLVALAAVEDSETLLNWVISSIKLSFARCAASASFWSARVVVALLPPVLIVSTCGVLCWV